MVVLVLICPTGLAYTRTIFELIRLVGKSSRPGQALDYVNSIRWLFWLLKSSESIKILAFQGSKMVDYIGNPIASH